MKCYSKDKHNSNNSGGDVQRHHRDSSLVPAFEHGGVTQLNEEDVDDAHGSEEQGFYCNWKTKKY